MSNEQNCGKFTNSLILVLFFIVLFFTGIITSYVNTFETHLVFLYLFFNFFLKSQETTSIAQHFDTRTKFFKIGVILRTCCRHRRLEKVFLWGKFLFTD